MEQKDPGREPTDAPVCGATTRVDGKFRTCELPNGHTSDHRTTLRGIEIWWPVDEPAAPVIGSNQCEHGHLARVCVTCELIAAEARIAELEAERDRLRQIVNATTANNKTLRKRLWDVRRVRDRVAETQRARIADLERENAEVAKLKRAVSFWRDGWGNLDQDNASLTARIAELEAALTAAADGLLRVESVSHLCNNCCAYETAHEVRQEWHGFDQVLAAPGKEPTDAE